MVKFVRLEPQQDILACTGQSYVQSCRKLSFATSFSKSPILWYPTRITVGEQTKVLQ